METNWATEHLQVIRTLMERSAVYRRALAPVMLLIGILGSVAGVVGWSWPLESSRAFALYWGGISLAGLSAAYLLVRRQALKDAEPFWSPPTRRVTQALLPALFAGWICVVLMLFPRWQDPLLSWYLPPIWMILYGCSLHAAGFFMPRGMKLFGWMFIVIGCGILLVLSMLGGVPSMRYAHGLMAAGFGGLHLAYGIYLYLTEQGKPSA